MGNEAIIVTKDDDVYALGFNGAGCLGVGDQNSTMEPRKIEPLCQKKVKGTVFKKFKYNILLYCFNECSSLLGIL